MMTEKNSIKQFFNTMYFTEVLDMLFIFYGVNVFANAAMAMYGYDVDSLPGGIIMGLYMVGSVILVVSSLLIPSIYALRYTLMCVFPMKSSYVAIQMSLAVDVLYLISSATDVAMMALAGIASKIPLKLILMVFLYIVTHITLYMNTNPALRQEDSGFVKKRMWLVFGFFYIAVVFAAMGIGYLICEKISYNTIYKVAVGTGLAVLSVSAAVTRILTGKGIKNKVRLIKVYKPSNRKKEESYV